MNMRSQIMICIKIKLVRKRFMRMPQIQTLKRGESNLSVTIALKSNFAYPGHDEVDDKWN